MKPLTGSQFLTIWQGAISELPDEMLDGTLPPPRYRLKAWFFDGPPVTRYFYSSIECKMAVHYFKHVSMQVVYTEWSFARKTGKHVYGYHSPTWELNDEIPYMPKKIGLDSDFQYQYFSFSEDEQIIEHRGGRGIGFNLRGEHHYHHSAALIINQDMLNAIIQWYRQWRENWRWEVWQESEPEMDMDEWLAENDKFIQYNHWAAAQWVADEWFNNYGCNSSLSIVNSEDVGVALVSDVDIFAYNVDERQDYDYPAQPFARSVKREHAFVCARRSNRSAFDFIFDVAEDSALFPLE